jgi:hypothetical protein
MNRHGLEQDNYLKGFGVMSQQSSSTIRFHQAELMIPDQSSMGKEICQNGNFVQNLARKHNHTEKPPQRGFDDRLQDYE